MSFEALTHANRTTDFTVPIFEDDGSTAVALAAADVVRVKIGRVDSGLEDESDVVNVDLDLDSVAATVSGSVVTIDTLNPASCTVRIAQSDVSSMSGAYDVEVLVVDDSETAPADAIKAAEYGVLHVVPSLDGDIGKT